MNVLLSIKPEFAEKILNGSKNYELRRTIFKRNDIEKIYLYSNSNIQKIVGYFEVQDILKGTPEEIWYACHEYAGISEEKFFEYFKGSKNAFAIKIKNVHKFTEPIDPYSSINNFNPPQSFYYLKNDIKE